MGSGQDLLPIGQFAEASRLSLKALRIYDRLGLLRPVRVDEQTGYRYYHDDQLRAARLISLLRRLEIVEYIYQLVRGGAPMGYDVKTRQVEGTQAVSVTQEVFVKELPGFIHTAGTALYRHIAASGGRPEGHLTVIYHGEVGEDSNGPVEVCIPVRQGSVPPRENVRLVELSAGTQAYTTITHAQLRFPEILKAYDAVYDWIKRNGRRPAGPPREIYFADVERARPNDPVCDVAWPVLSETGV